MRFLLYIWIFGIALQVFDVKAQSIHYSKRTNITSGPQSMSLHINSLSVITLNTNPIQFNDQIFFYYDSNGIQAPAGKINYTNLTSSFLVFGDTSLSSFLGHKENSFLSMSVYSSSENCYYENGDPVFSSGKSTFQTNRKDTIVFWNGRKSSIKYPKLLLCTNNNDTVKPFVSGISRNLKFKAQPTGLIIDSLTGFIVPKFSATGTYRISFQTQSCLADSGVTIEISDPNANAIYSETALCAGIIQSSPPISPQIINGSDFTFFANPIGINLDENTGRITPAGSLPGKYTIQLFSSKCLVRTEIPIEIVTKVRISYPFPFFCQNDTHLIVPQVIGRPSFQSFSVIPSNLNINTADGSFKSELKDTGTYAIRYSTLGDCATDTTLIVSVRGSIGDITFSDSLACLGTINLVQPNQLKTGNYEFFTNRNGLQIDRNTGQIQIDQSTPGSYLISNRNNQCYNPTPWPLRIKAPFRTIYTSDSVCSKSPIWLSPLRSYTRFSKKDQIEFRIPGLEVDSFFRINLQSALPGNYTVKISEKACKIDSSEKITILKEVPFNSDAFKIAPQICNSKGSFEYTASFLNGTNFYLFHQNDTLFNSNPIFNQLQAGQYVFKVEKSQYCFRENIFSIDSIPCNQKSTTNSSEQILAPLSMAPLNTFPLQCNQSDVHIFNKNAFKVRTIRSGTNEWDGKNDQGQLLPQGLYILFCGDKEKIAEVTIVYP